MRVVVVGAGIAGLSAALGAARDGNDVTVIEQDPSEVPLSAEGAFGRWQRPGTPQSRLHHGFGPRARYELETHAPDVLAALSEGGVTERDLRSLLPGEAEPEDRLLRGLGVRRPVLEWQLRRSAQATVGLRFHTGTPVAGVMLEDSGAVRIVGVRCGSDAFAADLVIDAGGRRSPMRSDLETLGVAFPVVRTEPCGIGYSSRYFRLRDGAVLPNFVGPEPERGDLGFMAYAIAAADARTYSLLFALPAEDRELRALRKPDAWDRCARLVERIAMFADPAIGEPITDPLPMYGLRNILRPWAHGNVPIVAGYAPVGDAWLTTDPLFGWGASFALAHGFGVAAALRHYPQDVDAAVESYHDTHRAEVEQRFSLACEDDRARCAHWANEPVATHPDEHDHQALLYAIGRIARRDPAAARSLLRRTSLLALPGDIWTDHDLVKRARAELLTHSYDPNRHTPGPSRDQVVRALRTAQ